MKRKYIIILLISFLIFAVHSEKTNVMTYDPVIDSMMITEYEDGIVKNKKIAIQLAEIYLTHIYGANFIKKSLPLTANLVNDIWYIYGTLPTNMEGGIPIIKISKNNGEVLGYINQK